MDGKVNAPRTVCKAILAVAIAAVAVAAIIGCESTGGGSRRQNIATVIQTACDLISPERSEVAVGELNAGCGREAVSNKIESLVAEGKLPPSQAMRLHALAQLAYEGIMDDLARGEVAPTNAVPASASQDGCDGCSIPDASSDCGDCNEDARCGNCANCKADE